jgi:adenylosuccinate synthase
LADLDRFTPQYEILNGWEDDLRSNRRWQDLPSNAQAYIQRIEELVDVPIRWISVGPERDQIVPGKDGGG